MMQDPRRSYDPSIWQRYSETARQGYDPNIWSSFARPDTAGAAGPEPREPARPWSIDTLDREPGGFTAVRPSGRSRLLDLLDAEPAAPDVPAPTAPTPATHGPRAAAPLEGLGAGFDLASPPRNRLLELLAAEPAPESVQAQGPVQPRSPVQRSAQGLAEPDPEPQPRKTTLARALGNIREMAELGRSFPGPGMGGVGRGFETTPIEEVPPEERNILQDFMAGFASGRRATFRGVGTTLESLGLERVGRALREGREPLPNLRPRERTGNRFVDVLRETAFDVGSGVATTVPSIVGGAIGTAVGGPVGGAVGALAPAAGLTYGGLREELEEEGVDPRTASRAAALVTPPSAALELLVPLSIGRRLLGGASQQAARGVAREIARSALREGVTEAATEAAQTALERGAVAATTPQKFLSRETLDEIIRAARAGGLTGGLLGGGATAVGGVGPSVPAVDAYLAELGRLQEKYGADLQGITAAEARNLERLARRVAEEAGLGEEVLEPIRAEERPGIRRRLADLIDPSARAELEAAYVDPLTSLPNQTAWGQARPRLDADPDTELVVVDLTNLKGWNDLVGMEAGNEAIRRVGEALRQVAEEAGVDPRNVFRAGGDEFVIAAPRGEGQQLAERIRELVPDQQIPGTELLSGVRTVVGSTFAEADQAMKAAKAAETGPKHRKPGAAAADETAAAQPMLAAIRTADGRVFTGATLEAAVADAVQNGALPPDAAPDQYEAGHLTDTDEFVAGAPPTAGTGSMPAPTPADQPVIPHGLGPPGTPGMLYASEMRRDPRRFQYKEGTDEQGVGRELKSVRRFDPDRAGVILVWRDPEDGEVYVINGHHRHELAERTGFDEPLLVRHIVAADDAEARLSGAMTNIAEGRGTAVDAAKIFRERGISAKDLEDLGISLTGAIARDGLALSNLHPALFQHVATGRLPVQRAVVIGASGLDAEQQIALWEMLTSREQRRQITNDQLAELIRFVRGAGEAQVTQESLFGEEVLTQSLALEKAELSAYVKKRLGQDRRLFGFLTRQGRARRIEDEGAGQIQVDRAGEIADAAAQAEEVYHRLSTVSGPVSDALTEAARQLAQGGDRNAIRSELYERVRDAIQSELTALTGREGAGARRSAPDAGGRDVAAGPVRPDQATQAEPPSGEVGPTDTETGDLFIAGPPADYGPDLFAAPPEARQPEPTETERPRIGQRTEPEEAPAAAPATPAADLPIRVSPDDIPYQVAYDAYRWNSFTPERRARQTQEEYVRHIEAVYEDLAPLARTEEQRRVLIDELERYRRGYVERELELLRATSRTASPMVTGPARFPVDRNRKALERLERLTREFIQWRDRAIEAMRRKIERAGQEDIDPLEAARRELAEAEALQEHMKRANAIMRRSGLSDEQKRQAMREAGIPDDLIQEAFTPDPVTGALGFGRYRFGNNLETNNARIRRLRQRIEELERRATRTTREIRFDGGRIVENAEADRLQIFFDSVPSQEIRNQLKSRGFRWSPREGAWQRQLTNQARWAASSILGVEIPAQDRPRIGERRAVYTQDITQTPEFRRWFGNSKVVDENGEPLVVYHGTTRSFDTFERRSPDIGYHAGTAEAANAIFTSKSDGIRPAHAPELGRQILPLYMRIERPLRVRDLDTFAPLSLGPELERLGLVPDGHAWAREVDQEGRDRTVARWAEQYPGARTKGDLEAAGVSLDQQLAELQNAASEVAIERLEAMGYDGLVYENQFEGGGDSWVAFRPEQIKSAIGNRGTFDPTDPSIVRESAPLYGGDVIRQHGAFTNPAPVDWNQPDNYYGVWTADRVRQLTGMGPDARVYRAILPADELHPSLAEAEDAAAIRGGTEAIDDTSTTNPPPVVVRKRADGSYDILDGNHRIALWQEIGYDGIPAWVIEDPTRGAVHETAVRYEPLGALEGTQVVDENGEPKVVFHGTPAPFVSFDESLLDPNALYGPGFYFTEDPEVAAGYSQKGPPQKRTLTTIEELRDYFRPGRIVPSYTGWDRVIEFHESGHPWGGGWYVVVQAVDPAGNPIGPIRSHFTKPTITAESAPNVRPARLRITRPFDINALVTIDEDGRIAGETARLIDIALREYPDFDWDYLVEQVERMAVYGNPDNEMLYNAIRHVRNERDQQFGKVRLAELLQRAGYDGITHIGGRISGNREHQVWIAFRRDQIRSAFGPADRAAQVGERRNRAGLEDQLTLDFGSVDEAKRVVRDIAEEAGPLLQISIPGVPLTRERIEAVRRGREAAKAWVPATGHKLQTRDGRLDYHNMFRLLRTYRHPAAEYWHVLVVAPDEDGQMRVAHHRMVSSGALDAALVHAGDYVEAAAIARRLGGEVVLAHNHPSGVPTPSPEDMDVTATAAKVIQRLGARFGGHFVINHEVATVIDSNNNTKSIHLLADPGAVDWDLHDRWRRISGPESVADYLSGFPVDQSRVDVLILNTQNQIVAFEARPIGDLDTLGEWLPALQRDAAAASIVIGTGGQQAYERAIRAANAISGVGVLDVVNAPTRESAVMQRRLEKARLANAPAMAPIFEKRAPYGEAREGDDQGRRDDQRAEPAGRVPDSDRDRVGGEPPDVRQSGGAEGVGGTADVGDAIAAGAVDPASLPTRTYTGRPADPLRPPGQQQSPIYRSLAGQLATPAEGKPGRLVSAPQVIEALARATEAAGKRIPLRVGRQPRGALGVFRVRPEVIRTRSANDIPTAAHEVAHAIEKLLFGWPQGGPWKKPLVSSGIQKELTQLGRALYGDTRPAGGYKREGWAEYIRIWVTESGSDGTPADPAKLAPLLHEWFEGEFSQNHPEVRSALEEARTLARRWREQGARARAEASMVDPASPRARAERVAQTVRRLVSMEKLIEMAQPLHELAREAERQLGRELKPDEDPFFTISALRTTHAARTRYMVETAMIDLAGNKVGPALADIRPLVKGKQLEFTIYLWARRAIALLQDEHGPRDPGLSMADAQQIIRELETPKFQLAAAKVYEWNDGVLNYAAQASPTFAEVVERVRERDPGAYVPLQRVFDELDSLWARSGRGGRAGATKRSPVKRLKGSGRRVKDIFQVMIAQAENTIRQAHARMVLDQVIRLSQIEGMGDLVEEITPDQHPVAAATIGDLIDRINREIFAADPTSPLLTFGEGTDGRTDVDSDLLARTLTFFAPAERPRGQDPIVPIYDQGRVRWFQVDGQLYDTLQSLDVYRLPDVAGFAILDWIFGSTARAFRAGTTGLRASFGLFWNPMRDVQTLYVNSRSGAAAPRLLFEWKRAMLEMALARTTGKQSEWVDTWIRLGGEMAQPLGQDIPHTRRAARRLFAGRIVRTLDPRNWFDFYRDLVQFPEGAPRIAEARLVAKQVGWTPGEPMTLSQSMQILLASKHVTTDFTAAGELARVINQMVPFFNAAIQGPRAHLRALRRNPQLFAWRGLQLAAATILLWWLHKDEEWYKEMDYRDRWLHWHFPFDWNGQPQLARIPRSFEIGLVFSALPEMLFDSWYRQEPEQVTEYMRVFFEVAAPDVLPVPARVAAEQLANREFFFDRPIETMADQRKPPEERFNEYTSRAAIMLGDLFNASPKRIDHAIQGMFGPVGGDVLSVLGLGPAELDREKELADLPIIGRAFQRGGRAGYRSRVLDELYQAAEEAQKKQYSDRNPETEEERQLRLQLNDAVEAVSALLYVRRVTPAMADRVQLTQEATAIAREVLELHKKGEIARSQFASERRRAQQLREEARWEEEERRRLAQERRRLPGAQKPAVAAPPRRP